MVLHISEGSSQRLCSWQVWTVVSLLLGLNGNVFQIVVASNFAFQPVPTIKGYFWLHQ